MATLAELPDIFLAAAAQGATNVWKKGQKAMRVYVRGYFQGLADIAQGVKDKEISKTDGKLYEKNARFLFAQAVSNMSQIILFEVQSFINKVLSAIKDVINSALPVPMI